ncbi:hypothetical protein [Chryseobacterium sp. JAH]|uniref:hypothetical protein n=1 Tax=Chryseobacterium sp. JAH TaxID=1742858 RepID=UPI000741077A|nr:hypothetical protein [Chryseobacterium sp. JAH]KUJ53306.1 hypothetical protein AR685_02645 [Chryseobacterium sp. JAH]
MNKILITIFFFSYFFIFSQSANLILQVNGKIITSEFANVYLKFDLENRSKIINVNYLPGDLSLTEEAWEIIKSQPEKKFYLNVDYYTYINGKQGIVNFEIELSKYLLDQKYLIADIYDFRNKSYKRKYQYLTDKHFLVQLYWRPENGVNGIYIPRR